MGDTVEDVDVEVEQKDNKIEFLQEEIRLPDCKIIEEMNKTGSIKLFIQKRRDDYG